MTELNLQAEYISFQDIPGTTDLYRDFLYHFDKVEPFYAEVAPRPASLVTFAPVIGEQEYPRDLIADVLDEQNRRFGSGPQTMANIEQLRDPGTVAVVTGQQAGLFTGPLYTILKALAIVRMSRDLRAQGLSVVPIFWIECEDHDQAEVDHCFLINSDGRRERVVYSIDSGASGKPVSQVTLTEAINQTTTEAVSLLPPSEFMPEIESQMRDAYRPGISLADGFARLMATWFHEHGLILLDPTDARLKRALTGMFERVIRGTSEITDRLITQSGRLAEAGYHSQLYVTNDSVPFFIVRDEKRVGLTNGGSHFALRSGDGSYTLDEILEVAHSQPEHISPGVALRPLVQDTLLPTLAYVGGPSEIAYFAQLKPLYHWLGRPVTPVLPRPSATMIERRYAKILDKHDLQFRDLFKGFDAVLHTVVETSLASQTAALFDATEASFEQQLEHIRQALVKTDPTLGGSVEKTRDKILSHLEQLRAKFTEARARKDESTVRQTQNLFEALYPEEALQERKLNILHFLSRYSTRFLSELFNTLDVWHSDHQVIFIG